MSRSFSTLSVSAILCLALTACSTTPRASTLMTGISAAELSKTFEDGELRDETDPVCVNFYKNARTFVTEANKPNAGNQLLKSVGISVLAGVVTNGVVGGIGSTAGRIAASRATSIAVSQGSSIALQGLEQNTGAAKKLTAAAEELNCPVNLG